MSDNKPLTASAGPDYGDRPHDRLIAAAPLPHYPVAQQVASPTKPAAAQWKSKEPGSVWEPCSVDEVEQMRAHNAEVRLLYAAPAGSLRT